MALHLSASLQGKDIPVLPRSMLRRKLMRLVSKRERVRWRMQTKGRGGNQERERETFV